MSGGRPKGDVLTRLHSKISFGDSDECWYWTADKTKGDYGLVSIDRRTRLAHRVMYEMWIGPIPEGFEVDHTCSVPSCVNPYHLEAVTPEENMRRRAARNLACRQGHPFTDENTYIRPNGSRTCRECKRAAHRRSRANRRSAA